MPCRRFHRTKDSLTANPPPAIRPDGVIATLALAGIVAAVTQTLVTPLLTDLPTILDTGAANATWVITATLLTGAVFGPVGGRLGDLYGKRRMSSGQPYRERRGSSVYTRGRTVRDQGPSERA